MVNYPTRKKSNGQSTKVTTFINDNSRSNVSYVTGKSIASDVKPNYTTSNTKKGRSTSTSKVANTTITASTLPKKSSATKKTVETKPKNSKANLGMNLEKAVNAANEYYLNNNIAVIHKKPTPIQIVKVSRGKKGSYFKIEEAYFKVPSTTDYNGLYKGVYIDFEAKEVSSKGALYRYAIHDHQIDHLERIYQHGGISFLIISFPKHDATYIVPGKIIVQLLKYDARPNISHDEIASVGYQVPIHPFQFPDYLKTIDVCFKEFFE